MERNMMNNMKKVVILIMATFLIVGCNSLDDEATLEKVIISDTAADVLLMDVQGLEDLDDIDSLITELNTLVEEENAESTSETVIVAVVEEQPVVNNETSDETTNEQAVENISQIEEKPVEEVVSTFMGKVQGVSNNKLYIEIVRMKRIDLVRLEKLSPAEKREIVNESIVQTGKNRNFIVNDETIITLQNGSEIELFNIKIGQLVSVTADSSDNAKEIKLIKLLREPR